MANALVFFIFFFPPYRPAEDPSGPPSRLDTNWSETQDTLAIMNCRMCKEPLRAVISIASRFENIEIVERALRDLCGTASVVEEDLAPLINAVWEATANAIRHGNHQQPDRKVLIDLAIEADAVKLRVQDEGGGFDASGVPDPTAPENLLRASGRGIFFMRQLMDRVEFTTAANGGTLVEMERRLQN